MQQSADTFRDQRGFAAGRTAAREKPLLQPDLTGRVQSTLNLFRILICAALLAQFFIGDDLRIFGTQHPNLFLATIAAYFALAVISGFATRLGWMPATVLAVAQSVIDIVAIVTLMHASGGIGSGLGGLLIVFIGALSLVLPLRYPTVLAAAATLTVLGQQLLASLDNSSTNYPAAGILSAIIFGLALAARPLAARIQASEAMARQFGIDLQNLSELNEYIVQHLRESIVVIDSSDSIRLINGSAAQLLEVEKTVRGRTLESVSAAMGRYLARWRKNSELSSHPDVTLSASGSGSQIKAHLAPLGKEASRTGPVLIFLEDASLMNARVQQSKLASLGRLSASIAHEIRNPVGAMSHAAQLLRESDGLAAENLRLTEIIQTHSERVSHIIDNVLQLSRRDPGQPQRLLLHPWAQEFQREFTSTHELQEGELTVRIEPQDLEIRMDDGHLRQVLWNLCDNAIKYASETGGICVELHGGRVRGHGRPFLEVMDSGHGVEPETAEKIFEPFYTQRSGGTGLGLYISRELCELNRATLMYLDRHGGGSIFRIVFADPDRWEKQDLS